MRSSTVDWILFVALGLMWGSSYLFIKIAVEDLAPLTLVASRLAIGAGLLWIVVVLRRQALPRQLEAYGHLIVMSLVNIAIPFLLITWAEQSVDSALAAILTALVPLFVGVLAPLAIPDEPLRANAVLGLMIGFAGVVALTSRELTGAGSSLLGVLALVAASVTYAVGGVYSRRFVRGISPMVPAVFQVTLAFAITTALAIFLEDPLSARPGAAATLSIVWLGLLGSGAAYLVFFRLLDRWGATRTSLVAYVIPIVGIVLGFLVLQEPIDARLLVGTALVIAGVAVVNGRYGRRVLFGRTARATTAVSLGK